MKRLLFYLIIIGCLVGCAKQTDYYRDEGGYYPWDLSPFLCFIENLSTNPGFNVYTIDEKKPRDYGNLGFFLGPDLQSGPYFNEEAFRDEYLLESCPEYLSFVSQKKDDLQKAKESAPFRQPSQFVLPYVFDGEIKSSPRVFSNKVLFGKTAGEDLSAFFEVFKVWQHYLFRYPDYTLKGSFANLDVNMAFVELYAPGTLLFPACQFRFKEIPAEEYDSLTITVEIPIYAESALRFLPDYKPEDVKVDTIMSGSVTIDFTE